jgi:hypothetical protein
MRPNDQTAVIVLGRRHTDAINRTTLLDPVLITNRLASGISNAPEHGEQTDDTTAASSTVHLTLSF